LRIVIELSSVNRKQSELNLILPRELESLEPRLRERLNQQIARGRVTLRLAVEYGKQRAASRVVFDTELAREYVQGLRRLCRELKLAAALSLDSLLRAPGVVEIHSPLEEPERLWSAIEQALTRALAAHQKMRAKEGAVLGKDLRARMSLIEKAAKAVALAAPGVTARYREALVTRLNAAGLPLALDDERLVKEIALFADRCDISEELTRLRSHFAQFADCVRSQEPVGRKLDFLVQELNREINTIGSKAGDAAIAGLVIEMKTELERFREQVQNVE
jgi:uncharacterized protein (TIGR00255 family)